MLDLAARRPTSADLSRPADRSPLTAVGVFLRHHWPAWWAASVLAGSAMGLASAPLAPASAAAAATTLWWRAATAAPLLMLIPGRWSAAVMLGAAFAASMVGGVTHGVSWRTRSPGVAVEPWTPATAAADTLAVVARITARPRVSVTGRWTTPVSVVTVGGGEDHEQPRTGASLLVTGTAAAPVAGSLTAMRLVLTRPVSAGVPGGFDQARWLAGHGVAWRGRVLGGEVVTAGEDPVSAAGAARDAAQDRLRHLMRRGLPPREASLAGSVLLGGGSEQALRDPFARLGLSHLFALSGLHVGILAAMLVAVLRPWALGPLMRMIITGVLLGGYVVLVDAPGSVVRAAGLVGLAVAAPWAGRRGDGLRVLGLLFWGGLAWDPAVVLDIGTRLSYLAAGGIVLGLRLVAPYIEGRSRPLRTIVQGLTVTLAAQTATMAEASASFGFLPLGAPLANLLLVPVFSAAVSLLAAATCVAMVWPWAGDGLFAAAWLLLRPLETLVSAGADRGLDAALGLPAWGPGRVAVFGITVAAMAWTLRRRGRAAPAAAGALLLALFPLASLGAWPRGGVTAWQLDVGQGDAAVVRLPDGWTCLIDTGDRWRRSSPMALAIRPFLRRHGVRRLDAVVVTHGHADHAGGVADLAGLPVGAWYAGGRARDDLPAATTPAVGDTLHHTPDWALVCVGPEVAAADTRNENDASVCLGLYRRGVLRALWTGDLEESGEHALAARLAAAPPGCDVWKAGHHGSRTSGSGALLEAARPALVVISCGLDNRHGHPSHGPFVAGGDTLSIVRTDLHGSVGLFWDGDGRFRARPMRPVAGR